MIIGLNGHNCTDKTAVDKVFQASGIDILALNILVGGNVNVAGAVVYRGDTRNAAGDGRGCGNVDGRLACFLRGVGRDCNAGTGNWGKLNGAACGNINFICPRAIVIGRNARQSSGNFTPNVNVNVAGRAAVTGIGADAKVAASYN